MDIVLKRVMAYVIDVLIVTLLMSFIVSQSFINPYIDEYMDSYNEYTELVQKAHIKICKASFLYKKGLFHFRNFQQAILSYKKTL